MVEGRLALEQLLASGLEVHSVLVADTRAAGLAGLLAGCPAPTYVADRAVLAATAGYDLHRGVLALGRRPPAADPAPILAAPGPVLVLEAVNDHENLGALFRTARALGAAGVLLSPTCADPLYRRSIRVSLGHVLRLPHATLEPWPAALGLLGQAGRPVVALTPSGATDLGRVGPSRRAALLIGAEGPGLSTAALAAADVRARIPMAAGVDSLNVAVAAGIALHHLGPGPAGAGGRP